MARGQQEEKVENTKKLRKNSWTHEEKKILKEKYEKSPRQELLEIFAHRTWNGIRSQAIKLKLKRTVQDGWCDAEEMAIKKGFVESQDPKLTPEARKLLIFKIINDVNHQAVVNNLRVKKWKDIMKCARKLELSWGVPENVAKEQLALLENLWDTDILLAFLIERRTAKDLEKKFGEPIDAIEKKLPLRIDKYELVSFRNSSGKTIYYYHERLKSNGAAQPRIWTPMYPEDENGLIDNGSLIIKFPSDLDWRQIRILPLAELHYGSKLCDEERFSEYLKLAKHQYHFFVINGGFFAIPPKGKIEDKVDFLFERQDELRNLLWPVAHKILWAHQGCTETSIERALDIDPLANVCKELDIPYFKRPLMAEVLWGKKHFSFYCIHGTTSAQKRGSMMNAVAGLLDQFESIDFMVMSHQKSGKENIVARIVRDRINCCLTSKDQHLVITPSFRKYEGSEEERKGKPLPSQGSCAMILFPDGGRAFSD